MKNEWIHIFRRLSACGLTKYRSIPLIGHDVLICTSVEWMRRKKPETTGPQYRRSSERRVEAAYQADGEDEPGPEILPPAIGAS